METNLGLPIKERRMGERRAGKREVIAYGIPISEWIKFAVFVVAFYVSVRITQNEVLEMKNSFQEMRASVEEMRKDINSVKLTNAVLVEQYNNDKQRRIEQLERELYGTNRKTH